MTQPERSDFVVVQGDHVRIINAESVSEAALIISRSQSVWTLRQGVETQVFKLGDLVLQCTARYERPDAKPEPGVRELLGGDYGRVVMLGPELAK